MSRAPLERATAYADTVIADLTYDDLQLATPCDGWDVGRVVLKPPVIADATEPAVAADVTPEPA